MAVKLDNDDNNKWNSRISLMVSAAYSINSRYMRSSLFAALLLSVFTIRGHEKPSNNEGKQLILVNFWFKIIVICIRGCRLYQ